MVLGQALHQVDELLPSSSLPFDDIAAAFLLVFFGIKTLQVKPSYAHHVSGAEMVHIVVQHLNMSLHGQLVMLPTVTTWSCILALLTLGITYVLP